MKRPQAEPTFPSLFDIRAAEVEEDFVIARCQFCNAEDKELVDMRLPALHLLKWTREACLLPELVFVDMRSLSPPCTPISSAPPLMRPRVSERVTEGE